MVARGTRTLTLNNSRFEQHMQKATTIPSGVAFFVRGRVSSGHFPNLDALSSAGAKKGLVVGPVLRFFRQSLQVEELPSHHYQVSPWQQSSHHPALNATRILNI